MATLFSRSMCISPLSLPWRAPQLPPELHNTRCGHMAPSGHLHDLRWSWHHSRTEPGPQATSSSLTIFPPLPMRLLLGMERRPDLREEGVSLGASVIVPALALADGTPVASLQHAAGAGHELVAKGAAKT